MIVRLVADIQNRLFWRVGTGRASECCVPCTGLEPGIPRWAAMCWLNSACRALILCVAVDSVVLIAAPSPGQQKGQVSGPNQCRLSRRFYRPLLRATLHTYLPAQTSLDRFRHSDAVRNMYAAAGCRAADSTDSHVQARCRSQRIPKPAGRSTGRNGPFQRGRLRADPARLPPRTPGHLNTPTGSSSPHPPPVYP